MEDTLEFWELEFVWLGFLLTPPSWSGPLGPGGLTHESFFPSDREKTLAPQLLWHFSHVPGLRKAR